MLGSFLTQLKALALGEGKGVFQWQFSISVAVKLVSVLFGSESDIPRHTYYCSFRTFLKIFHSISRIENEDNFKQATHVCPFHFPVSVSRLVQKIMACESKSLTAVSLPRVEIVFLYINKLKIWNNELTEVHCLSSRAVFISSKTV